MRVPIPFRGKAFAVVISGFLLAGCAASAATLPADAAPAEYEKRVQADIDRLTELGVPGVVATVTVDGRTTTLVSGAADLAGAPLSGDLRVRVGSITKTFVAVVALQLVGEGVLDLDRTVDSYWPGLLVGDSIAGSAITVRQLLQHRSGLPEFSGDPRGDELAAFAAQNIPTPRQVLAIALSQPAQFAPGAEFRYTNTNYVVVGMLVERLTGNTVAAELQRRILDPLGLNDTYLPEAGEVEIRGDHPIGYQMESGELVDVSRIEPAIPWAAGALVSTGADLNSFYAELVAGNVLAPPQLAEMASMETNGGHFAGLRYGIGRGATTLPCGVTFVGHPGGIPGYFTLSGATNRGAVTITLTRTPTLPPNLISIVADALC